MQGHARGWALRFVALAALIIFGPGTTLAGAVARAEVASPIPTVTPGATSPAVTQDTIRSTICTVGYTKTVRSVTQSRRNGVWWVYGVPAEERRGYVIDHLIPLELGGSNDLANLWPEKRSDSYRKDKDEDSLHDKVCSGAITLDAARAFIVGSWTKSTVIAPPVAPAPPPAPAPTVAPSPPPPPAPAPLNCPNGSYTNSAGNQVCSPYAAPGPPSGATAQCRDGTYSFSQSRSGTCSSHGGVAQWL